MPRYVEVIDSARSQTERDTVREISVTRTSDASFAEWVLSKSMVALADGLTVGLVASAVGVWQWSSVAAWSGVIAIAAIALAVFGMLWQLRLWTVGMQLSTLDEMPKLFAASLAPPVVGFFLTSLFGLAVDVWVFAALAGAMPAGLMLERSILRTAQRTLRRRGHGLSTTLVVGAGHIGSLIARRLKLHPELGLLPIGFIDKDPLTDVGERQGLPVLGNSRDLARLIHEFDVKMVVVAFSTAPHEVLLRIVTICQEKGVALAVVPRLFETIAKPGWFERLRGIPVIGIRPIRLSGGLWWTKRVVDVAGSALALVLASPVLLAAAVMVKLDSAGPVFYRQVRSGRDGKYFQMIKFRSLAVDAEAQEGGAMWSDAVEGTTGGSYITRVGKILRKSSLDELPQLLNVLKGEMSLVGPRPERPFFVNRFVHDIYRYGDRMRVKAGMTGWAQVHDLKGNQGSLAERVEYDNYYIENWSPWLDLRIVLLTFQQVYRDLRGVKAE